MTMMRRIPVTCPRCGKEGSTLAYDSVNVSLDGSLKEKLLSGELIKWQCEGCGAQRLNAFPLLYHDMKGVLIQWTHPAYAETESDLMASLPKAEVCQEFLSMKADYRFRVVREFDDLVEKIRIFDAGLDDRAVEWVKYYFAETAGKVAAGKLQIEKIEFDLVMPRFRGKGKMEGVDRLEIAGPIAVKLPGMAPMPFNTYAPEDLYRKALAYADTHLPWPKAINGHFYLVDRGYIERAWGKLPSLKDTGESIGEFAPPSKAAPDVERKAAKPWWKVW